MKAATEVCRELGCLPLAIEQAAAFMSETATSPREYLRLLGEYPAELYAHGPAGTGADRTVARVWHAALDHLAAETPQAGPVLRVLAWFAPDHIPRNLLDPLADGWGGPIALHRSVGRLAAYSMITLTRSRARTSSGCTGWSTPSPASPTPPTPTATPATSPPPASRPPTPSIINASLRIPTTPAAGRPGARCSPTSTP
ncbi:hypothetical protein GCM10010182_01040 [Actinomadura cremea]|nr:hypothetical protein GCM10010182_01040 [Actinomadura cremea]